MRATDLRCVDPCDIPCPKVHIVYNSDETAPSLSCGVLSLQDYMLPYMDIESVFLVCPKDAAAQVDDFTPTVFPDTDCCGDQKTYGITLDWNDSGCDDGTQLPFKVTLEGTQDADSVVDALVEKINAHPDSPVTASNTSSKLRLTANEDGIVIQYTWTEDTIDHTLITEAQEEFGTPESLADQLCFDIDTLDPDGEYEVIIINYRQLEALSEHNMYGIVKTSVAIAFNTADTDAADSEDDLCEIVDGSHSPTSDYYCKTSACPCSEISS